MITATGGRKQERIGQEHISGDFGDNRLDLYAQGNADHVALMGSAGADSIALGMSVGPQGTRRIHGHVGLQLVDVDEQKSGSRTTLTGTFGGRPVELVATGYAEGSTRITGHIGSAEANILQHDQWDGHILSGNLGRTTVTLTENEVSGLIPDLQPLDFIIALGALNPKPTPPVSSPAPIA